MESESPEGYVDQLKKAGIKVMHHALPINVEVAKRSEELGVDAIIAVGHEGGGMGRPDTPSTFVLLPEIVDAVKIPVVAGGGIVDGRGLVSALALGAAGVYVGTRFMATHEAGAHPDVKKSLLDANVSTVVLGDLVTRRLMKNQFTERMSKMQADGTIPARERARVLNHGLEDGLSRGDAVNGGIACGAGVRTLKEVLSAKQVIEGFVSEADKIIAGL
jgi:NAD(P)H-dependent flavin oxidoreductase YrpB (nitropropane dioxygenase family)